MEATTKLLKAMQYMTEINQTDPSTLTPLAPAVKEAAVLAGQDPEEQCSRLAARFVAKAANAINGSVTYTSALTMYYTLYNSDHECSHVVRPFNIDAAARPLLDMAADRTANTTDCTEEMSAALSTHTMNHARAAGGRPPRQ